MSNAPRIFRPQRVLVIAGATLLLHVLAAGWVAPRLTIPGVEQEALPAMPQVIFAQLRPMPLAPVAVAEPQAPATPARRSVQPRPASMEGAAEKTAGYQVSVPPAATLMFDVIRRDPAGATTHGEGSIDWQHDGAHYHLRCVVSMMDGESMSPAPQVTLASEGTLDKAGIMPRTMTEQRGQRAPTAVHFNASAGRVTFSASQAQVAMTAGAQDKATFLMQLAGIGRAGATQLATGVNLLVGEMREANVYEFVLVGEEEIETGIGPLPTWHVARVTQPGSYNTRLDIWLAPGRHWYPVQLRSAQANGVVTTQTIRSIVLKEN